MPTSRLPPKKQARAAAAQNGSTGSGSESDEEVTTKRSIFDAVDNLPAKRARPEGNQLENKLQTWLEDHLEEKADKRVSINSLYDFYIEECSETNSQAVELTHFKKAIKDKFPSGFTVKNDSSLFGEIKEMKVPKKPAVKADSLSLKMKDILENVLIEAGNPKKGIRFSNIKMAIAHKYPALRMNERPKTLMNSLERGIRYGQIELVKGVGAAGFYRLWVEGEDEEEEEKEEGGEEQEEGGEKEEGKEDESSAAEEGEEGKKKKKKKKRGPTEYKKKKISSIVHSNPQRIEETFPLAMTFMSEPKESTFLRIKKYIDRYYPKINTDRRLLEALDSEDNVGLWTRVSGSGERGTFVLEATEFDPEMRDDLSSIICCAITATNEPKQCSASALKDYIQDYHSNYDVEHRPHLFKMAIERAINYDLIRRISGLGATGSFQLSEVFTPTPSMLAGTDTGDSEDEDEEYVDEEAYKPRPTKRKGHGRAEAAYVSRWMYDSEEEEYYKPKPKKVVRNLTAAAKAKNLRKPRTTSYRETSEEEDDEDYEPSQKKKIIRKIGRRRSTRQSKTDDEPTSEKEESEESDVDVSEKKAAPKAKKSTPKKNQKAKQEKRKGRGRPRKQESDDEAEDDDDEVSEEEVAKPTPARGRGRGRTKSSRAKQAETPSRSRGRTRKQISYAEEEDVEEEEEEEQEEEEEVKEPPKKKGGKAKKGKRKAEPEPEVEEESEEEKEENVESESEKEEEKIVRAPKGKSRKKSRKRRR